MKTVQTSNLLEVGTQAPSFELKDQDEMVHTLEDQKGKWTLIYFYPKDDTPGCTKEACAISEVYSDFEKMGVTVFGVSKDSPKSHTKFITKYNLPFRLLSDESTEMMQEYKVWSEKSMYGKKYMGTNRVSYLINPNLKIVKVYPKVDPANHALELLQDLAALVV